MSYWTNQTYHVDDKMFTSAYLQCMQSEYVRTNKSYLERAVRVQPVYQGDMDWVNSYAARIDKDMVRPITDNLNDADKKKYFELMKYMLVLPEGMCRWITVLATVAEILDRTGNVAQAKKMLKWMCNRVTGSDAGSDFTKRFNMDFNIRDDGRRYEIERSYAMGMMVALIGHELGHCVLGHVDRDDWVNSTSRNDERSADMFSSSIIHSLGTGEMGAISSILFEISLFWFSGKGSVKRKFSTHPTSIERINLLIETFEANLVTSRITKEMLQKLVKGVK